MDSYDGTEDVQHATPVTKWTLHGSAGFLLTLKGSPRVSVIADEILRTGLDRFVTMLMSERDMEDGIRGCFKSHVNAIRCGLQDPGVKTIFVFEDDVYFAECKEYDVKFAIRLAHEAIVNEGFDCVALGAIPIRGLIPSKMPHVFETVFHYTHAYAVSRSAAETIAKWEYRANPNSFFHTGAHFDHRVAMEFRQGMLVPTVAFQRDIRGLKEEVTTTDNSSFYVFIVRLRNLASAKNFQTGMVALFRVIGWVVGFFNRPKSMSSSS